MGPFQIFAALLVGFAILMAFFVWYGDWKEAKKASKL